MRRKAGTVALILALAACATSSPASSRWAEIEGCWIEHWPDHWPASVEWRRDPERPGGYVGRWQREAAQMDVEEARLTLAPVGERMEFCLSFAGGEARCAPAVFGGAGWRQDGVAVLDVGGEYLQFGFAGASLPFFWGRRASCT